jgi:hypothetical protein
VPGCPSAACPLSLACSNPIEVPAVLASCAAEHTEVEREGDGIGVVLIAQTCYMLWREESVARRAERRF